MNPSQTYANLPISTKENSDTEIKTIKKKIISLDHRIKSLNELYKQYQELINKQINEGELAQRVQTIESDVRKMNSLYEKFKQNLKEIRKERDSIQTVLDTIMSSYNEFTTFNDRLGNISNEMQKIKEDIDKEIPQIKSELTQIPTLQQKIKKVPKTIRDEYTKNINQVKDDFKTKVQETENKLTERSNNIEEMVKQLEERMKSQMNEEIENIRETMEKKYESLFKKHQKLRKEFDDFEIGNINDNVNNLLESRDKHEESIQKHEETISQLLDKENESERQIQLLCSQLDEFNQHFEDKINNVQTNTDNALKGTNQKITEINQSLLNLKSMFEEEIKSNKNDHQSFLERFVKIESHIQSIEANLQNIVEGNEKFKYETEENFNNLSDGITQKMRDVDLAAESMKRTLNSQLKYLDNSMNETKYNVDELNFQIEKKFKKFEESFENMKLSNRKENNDFQENVKKIIVDIRDQSDITKQEIKNWNDDQFKFMKDKLKKMSLLLKSLKGADGTTLDVLLNKINEKDNGIQTKLSDALLDIDKIKMNQQNERIEIDQKLSIFFDKVTSDISVYKQETDSSFSDNIHLLQNKIKELESNSYKMINEAHLSIDNNKTIFDQTITELFKKINAIVTDYKTQNDIAAKIMEKLNNDFISAQKDFKFIAESIETSHTETINREKMIILQINQAINETNDIISKNDEIYVKQFKEIQKHFIESDQQFSESKLTEETIKRSITKLDDLLKRMINSLETKIETTTTQTRNIFENRFSDIYSQLQTFQSFYNLFRNEDNEINVPYIFESLTKLKTQLTSQSEEFQSQVNSLKLESFTEINKLKETFYKEITTMQNDLENFKGNSNENLIKTLQDIREKFNSSISEFSNNLSNMSSQVNSIIGDSPDVSLTSLINNINTLKNDLTTTRSDILNESRSQDKALQDQLSLLNDQLSNYQNTLSEAFKQSKLSTENNISDFKETINGNIVEFKNIVNNLTNEMNRISDNGKLTMQILNEKLNEMKTASIDAFNQTDENAKELYQKLNEQIKQIKNEIKRINGNDETESDLSLSVLLSKITNLTNELAQAKSDHKSMIDLSNERIDSNVNEYNAKFLKFEEDLKDFDDKLTTVKNDMETSSTIAKESNQKQYAEIQQQIKTYETQLSSSSKKRKKKLLDIIRIEFEKQFKLNDEIILKQSQIETKSEENERKIESEFNQLNDRLMERIGKVQNASIQTVDDKISELREKIRKLESDIRDSKNIADQSINAVDSFFNDEVTKIKADLAKIRGSSDESIQTLDQSIKMIKEQNESRFKSVEDQSISLTNLLNQKASNLEKQFFSSEKEIQGNINVLTVQFQDLSKVVADSLENVNKESHDKIDQFEHSLENFATICMNKIEENQKQFEIYSKTAESTNNSEFESIKTSIQEMNKVINDEKSKTEKLVNDMSQHFDEYFKNDNSAIRQLINETSESFSQKITSAVNDFQTKLNEIGTLSESLQKNHMEDFSKLNGLVNDYEERFNSKLIELVNPLKESNLLLSHQMELLSHMNEENKKNFTEFQKKGMNEFEKIKADIIDSNTRNNENFDELFEIFKKHIKKRKQDIRNLKDAVENEMNGIKGNIDQTNQKIDDQKLIEKESLKKLKDEFNEVLSDQSNKHAQLKSLLSKDIKELNLELTNKFKSMLDDQLSTLFNSNSKIDLLEETLHHFQGRVKKGFYDVEAALAKIDSTIELSQSILRGEIESSEQKFNRKNLQTLGQIEEVVAKQSLYNSQLASALIELEDLKKIHYYNAEMETFSAKFEQLLSKIELEKAKLWSFIYSAFMDNSLQIESNPDEKNIKKYITEFSKYGNIAPLNTDDVDEITTTISNNKEIGLIIRRKLNHHNSIKIVIPKSTNVIWNKTVTLGPHQKLVIIGEDPETSVIQMEGIKIYEPQSDASFQNNSNTSTNINPSRCIIDGESTLSISNLKIVSNIGYYESEQVDMRALFVVQGLDAFGSSIIQISSCSISSDHNIINIAGNSLGQVILDNCTFSNLLSKADENSTNNIIYPVTAESGDLPSGYGVISERNISLSGKGIQWLKSQFLLRDHA